jgi:mannosyltransferase OCH1-like enzyme
MWDDVKIKNLLEAHDKDLYTYYTQASSFAQKSDIARYLIVYLYGGIYIDSDYKCQKPLDSLIGPQIDFFYIPFEDIGGLRIVNGLFGCKEKHDVLKITMDNLKKRFNQRDSVTSTTGTRLFFDSIVQYHKLNPEDSRYAIYSYLQLFPCNAWENQNKCNDKWKDVSFMTHMNEGSWSPIFFFIKIYAEYKIAVILFLLIMVCLSALFLYRKYKA